METLSFVLEGQVKFMVTLAVQVMFGMKEGPERI